MITWITDKIGIGDEGDAKQLPSSVYATLNVAIDLDVPTIGNEKRHKIGLLDGPGNDEFTLMSAVLMLHSLNRQYDRVMVHCYAGQSRSVMVVATYVAVVTGMDFDGVLQKIMEARKVSEYRKPLYQQCRQMIPHLRKIIGK
jgi:protein-tyrosine phosphatase